MLNIKSYKNVFINYVYSLNNEELDIDEEFRKFLSKKEKMKLEFVGITNFEETIYNRSDVGGENNYISSENPEKEYITDKILYFYEDNIQWSLTELNI